ncbi:MAG: HAMP domain-containing sensor histidine kinase, partial [Verrucomicrobiota bacterium]
PAPGGGTTAAMPDPVRPATGQIVAALAPAFAAQPFVGQPGRPPDNNPPARGRFLVRTVLPPAYWAGVHLPPIPDDFGGGIPATLLMRADSLGATALLLDLDPWLWAAGVAVGLSVVFWLPLVRSITRSLGELTRATEQIAEGRFDTRVDESRRDELGRLGVAVNQMAEQLDRAATGQKRFLGDIAHELGSPVGRLQVAVSILEEQAAPALQPAVADVREEVQQMSELVGELLAFTRAGLRARDAALARVELAPLVADVLTREGAEGKVVPSIPAGLAAEADAALLARALANLVRNALRYAGHAGPVTLTALAEGEEIVIAVEDSGPGVPADTLERLGEPFYRPEFARTRETGGVGLGLAIVKSAAEACRGTVSFSNRHPHGFRAELRLVAA